MFCRKTATQLNFIEKYVLLLSKLQHCTFWLSKMILAGCLLCNAPLRCLHFNNSLHELDSKELCAKRTDGKSVLVVHVCILYICMYALVFNFYRK